MCKPLILYCGPQLLKAPPTLSRNNMYKSIFRATHNSYSHKHLEARYKDDNFLSSSIRLPSGSSDTVDRRWSVHTLSNEKRTRLEHASFIHVQLIDPTKAYKELYIRDGA